MLLKTLLIVLLLFVIFNLFQALYFMIKHHGSSPRMSKYLGRRLLFSALIALCIIVALATGLAVPNPSPL
ncbi:MAG TPA: DUF2909 domain-containing protein [Cellvibrio sp.]|nr:DUF2909 domain-containing protein [Cellvibrio sp.]